MKIIPLVLISWLFCLFGAGTGKSEEQSMTLFMTEIPAQTMHHDTAPGIARELVLTAVNHAGLRVKEEFLPWLRAMQGAEVHPGGMIVPFSRTASREDRFQWIEQLYDLHFGFVSNTEPINSWEQAKALRGVGVWRGSSMQSDLEQRGFRNLYVLSDDRALVKLMVHRRIEAWYGALLETAWKFRDLPASEKTKLHYGAAILSYPAWLAASREFDSATVQKLRNAFKDLRADGRFTAILRKYGLQAGSGS